MALDPTAATAKWVSRMQAAAPEITAGVNAVSEAPGVAAAKQAHAWLTRITASVDKWKRNVSAVTLEQWKTAMIDRGIPAINAGVNAKSGNYQAYAVKAYPYIQTGVNHVKGMPKGTLAQSQARAAYFIEYMSKYALGGGRTA
jgi:hypothetical protein